MNIQKPVEEYWLSRFLVGAHENMERALVELPEHWHFLTELDQELGEGVLHYSRAYDERRQAGYLLLPISHNHFICAIRMAMSGQCLAVFPAGRAALESSLYSWYLIHHPDAEERWFKKPKDPSGRRAWGKEFSFRSIVNKLGKDHADVKDIAISLHEMSIDYGSHPNVMSISSNIVKMERDGYQLNGIKYLHDPDSMQFINSIKFVNDIGLFILKIICISDREFPQNRKVEERLSEFINRYNNFVDQYIKKFASNHLSKE